MSQGAFDSNGEDFGSQPIKLDKGKQKSDEIIFESFSPAELEQETAREIGDVVGILGLEVPQFFWIYQECP